ncbi:MAG: hypothetical protein C0602_05635 [Denitrovibrio sp.]|nr:MAG: hypothetical protein C0602_05635 [Denitrovibrio sp.]
MIVTSAVYAAESGEDLFYKRCTACHSSALSMGKKKDEIMWKSTIKRMKKHGASISSQETEAIADFLSGKK